MKLKDLQGIEAKLRRLEEYESTGLTPDGVRDLMAGGAGRPTDEAAPLPLDLGDANDAWRGEWCTARA